jgi:fumarylacetoacetate (FAA) hydrolase family protein
MIAVFTLRCLTRVLLRGRVEVIVRGVAARNNSLPQGVFLLTGAGILTRDYFTLASGDVIRISIDGIGTLENPVA